MTTLLDRPVHRQINDLVVTIEKDGIRLRAYRKQKSVKVSFAQIAEAGLQNGQFLCNDRDWRKPLETLKRLARIPRRFINKESH